MLAIQQPFAQSPIPVTYNLPQPGPRELGSPSNPNLTFGIDADVWTSEISTLPSGGFKYTFVIEVLSNGSWTNAEILDYVQIRQGQIVSNTSALPNEFFYPDVWTYTRPGCHSFRFALYFTSLADTGIGALIDTSESFDINVLPGFEAVIIEDSSNGNVGSSLEVVKGSVLDLEIVANPNDVTGANPTPLFYQINGLGTWLPIGNTSDFLAWDTGAIAECSYTVQFMPITNNDCGVDRPGIISTVIVVPPPVTPLSISVTNPTTGLPAGPSVVKGQELTITTSGIGPNAVFAQINGGEAFPLNNVDNTFLWSTSDIAECNYTVSFQARTPNGCGEWVGGPLTTLEVLPTPAVLQAIAVTNVSQDRQSNPSTVMNGDVLEISVPGPEVQTVFAQVNGQGFFSLANTENAFFWNTNQFQECLYTLDLQAYGLDGCGNLTGGPIRTLQVEQPAAILGSDGYASNGKVFCNGADEWVNLAVDDFRGVPHWRFRIDGGEWSGVWTTEPNPRWATFAFDGSYSVEMRVDMVSTALDPTGQPCDVIIGEPFAFEVFSDEPLALGSGGYAEGGNRFCDVPGVLVPLRIDDFEGQPEWYYKLEGGAWTFFSNDAHFDWLTDWVAGPHQIDFRCDVSNTACGFETVQGEPFTVLVEATPTTGTDAFLISTSNFVCNLPSSWIELGIEDYTGALTWQYRVGDGVWTDWTNLETPSWSTIAIPGAYTISFRASVAAEEGPCTGTRVYGEPLTVTVEENCGFWEEEVVTSCEGESLDVSFYVSPDLGLRAQWFLYPQVMVLHTSPSGRQSWRLVDNIDKNGKAAGTGWYNWRLPISSDWGPTESFTLVNRFGAVYPFARGPVTVNFANSLSLGSGGSSSSGSVVCGDIATTTIFTIEGHVGNPRWFLETDGGPQWIGDGAQVPYTFPGGNEVRSFFVSVESACGGTLVGEPFTVASVVSPELGTGAMPSNSTLCAGSSMILNTEEYQGSVEWLQRQGENGFWEVVASDTSVFEFVAPPGTDETYYFRADVIGINACVDPADERFRAEDP
ncbi:MAG: hypothetical protein AAGA85_13795, partial [Bacteroidota bacterium]